MTSTDFVLLAAGLGDEDGGGGGGVGDGHLCVVVAVVEVVVSGTEEVALAERTPEDLRRLLSVTEGLEKKLSRQS